MCDMIGKQRSKEWNIDRKLSEIKSSRESIQSIHSAESEIKAAIQKIEEDWRRMVSSGNRKSFGRMQKTKRASGSG